MLFCLDTMTRDYTKSATHTEWNYVVNFCRFLEGAAMATDSHWRTNYVTFSFTVRIVDKLLLPRNSFNGGSDPEMFEISKIMRDKLLQYWRSLKTPLARLVRIVDGRFKNDILTDAKILRQFVFIPVVMLALTRRIWLRDIELPVMTNRLLMKF